jgi:hypothetical protein
MKWGSYECADNEYHVADKKFGWQDLSHPKDAEDALVMAAVTVKMQLPLPVNKIAVTMTVKPPEPVLKSPLSKWGQAMREKLDGLKKGS